MSTADPQTWHYGLVSRCGRSSTSTARRSIGSGRSWKPASPRWTQRAAPDGCSCPISGPASTSTARTSPRTCSTAFVSAASARARSTEPLRAGDARARAAAPLPDDHRLWRLRDRGNRKHDMQGLRRLREHLEAGGTLVLDRVPRTPIPRGALAEGRAAELPRPWRDKGDRRALADGSELELRGRLVEVDPLEQCVTREIHAFLWRAVRSHRREARPEGDALLHARARAHVGEAGFVDFEVRAGYEDRPLTADDDFAVFIARKP